MRYKSELLRRCYIEILIACQPLPEPFISLSLLTYAFASLMPFHFIRLWLPPPAPSRHYHAFIIIRHFCRRRERGLLYGWSCFALC